MAVYTAVSPEELSDFLALYGRGTLAEYCEIGEGIENSNYFVTLSDNSQWVLTLFENLAESELPFFLNVMCWLARKGIPAPAPCLQKGGGLYSKLQGKPAILVPRFQGRSLVDPSVEQCSAVGVFLARMHLALKDCPLRREPPRDLAWMSAIEARLAQVLPSTEMALVNRAIEVYRQNQTLLQACPSGLIHGDLFRDNLLFEGNNISGVIDFFHACNEALLFDLAVAANDWTTLSDGRYNHSKLTALIAGYQSVRPWEQNETELWPHFLHLAALRFWLSRLESRYLPGYQQLSTQGDKTKDPDELKRIILSLGLI